MDAVLTKVKNEGEITFVDIGCNIGQTMLKALDRFENHRYVGFDTNKYCISFCQEIINDNQLNANHSVINCAIGNSNAIIEIPAPASLDKFNSSLSIIKGFRTDSGSDAAALVPCFQFDSISRDLSLTDLSIVKIDVEGAELEVLLGMEKSLRQHRPIVFIEILPVYNSSNFERLERQRKIEQLFRRTDYDIFRILKVEKFNFMKIESIGIHANLDNCDYVCLPKESKGLISGSHL